MIPCLTGHFSGEAVQAKSAERTPAEQNTQTQQTTNNGYLPSEGTDIMQLISDYWYVPAGLLAVLILVGVMKRK